MRHHTYSASLATAQLLLWSGGASGAFMAVNPVWRSGPLSHLVRWRQPACPGRPEVVVHTTCSRNSANSRFWKRDRADAFHGAGAVRPSSLTVRSSSAGGVLEPTGDEGMEAQAVVHEEQAGGTTHAALDTTAEAVSKALEEGSKGEEGRRRGIQWFQGLREDVRRRMPLYKSDWTDGLHGKTVPAILFLYFACLAPAVAFGGISYGLTKGSMGVIEFLLSCGMSGMIYSVFSGQPMTFIGPTGLTLCFTATLFNFCQKFGVAFFPMYAWVGGWTSLMLLLLSAGNACTLIRHCTRFTDEVFNALLALNFIVEALRSIVVKFRNSGADKTQPLLALNMALATFGLSQTLVNYRSSKLFSKRIRAFLSDFGPALTIIIMTCAGSLPWIKRLGVDFLKAPKRFMLAGDRPLLIPFWELPLWARGAALIPAMLLTVLFYLDHNISIRVVNSSDLKMKKGPAYHLDLFVLGFIVFISSLLGLPWMCAATIQSLNHVRSVSDYVTVKDESGVREEVSNVMETRLTGLGIHALVFASIALLPYLRTIPNPVISGIFLYLGRKVMQGNTFLQRVKGALSDKSMMPADSPFRVLGRGKVNKFTAIQVLCLTILWTLKSNPATGMFFPSVIGLLMVVRNYLVPRLFSKKEIELLDD